MQRPFEFVSHTKILHNSNRTSILFSFFFLQLPLSGKGNAGVRTLHCARSVKCTLRFHHIARVSRVHSGVGILCCDTQAQKSSAEHMFTITLMILKVEIPQKKLVFYSRHSL